MIRKLLFFSLLTATTITSIKSAAEAKPIIEGEFSLTGDIRLVAEMSEIERHNLESRLQMRLSDSTLIAAVEAKNENGRLYQVPPHLPLSPLIGLKEGDAIRVSAPQQQIRLRASQKNSTTFEEELMRRIKIAQKDTNPAEENRLTTDLQSVERKVVELEKDLKIWRHHQQRLRFQINMMQLKRSVLAELNAEKSKTKL